MPYQLEPVLNAFPEWRCLLRVEMADDGSLYEALEVDASPSANAMHGLLIKTSNEEITVGFDFYHTHFDDSVGDGTYFGTMAALEFIKQIKSEQLAVMSWWRGDQWCGSSSILATEKPELPSWCNRLDINRIRIRSWCGTLNADIDV